MVNNACNMCVEDGFRKTPTRGVVGTKLGVVCAKHAANGMINVVTKRCAHLDCSSMPRFGVDGNEKVDFVPHTRSRG